MKNLEDFGIKIPQILLPADGNISTWSVIACDQYTQDKAYWENVQKNTNGKPSTLNLILPEVYLNDNKSERIQKIRKTMNEYLDSKVFAEPKNCFVYIERKTSFGRTRKGLIVAIDLDTYEWKPFSKANIRATEATIVDRIPPRMEIRKGAPLELPHIMLLVNDKEQKLIEQAGNLVKNNKPLYSGNLMSNGGSISGWELSSKEHIDFITKAINEIAEKNTSSDGSTFLFAVGDGNHSLATAKAVWEEYKKELIEKGTSQNDIQNCPVKYALIEIVNLYDAGLTFEPIHRVIFNINPDQLISHLQNKLGGSIEEVASAQDLQQKTKESLSNFGFTYKLNGKQIYKVLKTSIKELAVACIQPEIDSFLKNQNNSEIDYIHGSEEVFRLGSMDNAVSIMLPPIAKDSFFETINSKGPLPRKSFSMGEADEKRFYLECRKLF